MSNEWKQDPRWKEEYPSWLFLDSGAFSAWMARPQETIDVKAYARFLHKFKHLLWTYVTLDVIPGARDSTRTLDMVNAAAKASYKNHRYLRDHGLNPIPVFHQGENWDWLARLIDDGETYIGVSPFKDIPLRVQCRWLDEVFTILTNDKGVPLVRVHGFGTTHPELLARYPFYTVDSTTWTLTPGYGQIIVPGLMSDGSANYIKAQRVITSGVQQQSGLAQAHQFDALGPKMRDWVEKFLHEEVGCTPTQAKYGTGWRRKAVLVYYMNLAKSLQGHTFKGRKMQRIASPKTKPLKDMPFHIVFSTNVQREWSHILTEAGARTRLLSYYDLREHPEWVEPYVTLGSTNPGYERTQPKQNWKSENYRNFRALSTLERLQREQAEEVW